MAGIEINKLKSKLTTRNNFTGRAMDRMTKENLKELFQGNLNYMSWEKTYLQRKFHPDEYLKQLREHRRAMFATQQENSPNSNINYDEMLREDEAHDIELQKRFERFAATHNGDKPLLVLDVDNTMVYVRFFSEEMQIGDVVTYFGAQSVSKNNSRVVEVRLTLSLEITASTLIDKVGAERMECNYWAKNNELLKKYKKKNGVFDYKIDEKEIIGCKIRKVEVTGCKIHVHSTSIQIKIRDEDEEEEEEEEEAAEEEAEEEEVPTIEIDFTKGNQELSKLEPMLERRGMAAVDFIYEGFLVRCRPNLDEFLEYCSDDFDVVIYTSANKLIYEGMLNVLHEYVKDQLGRQDEEELLLWSDTLYRDDCTLDYDERGKPYHHKDLTLFGCDLSRLIMVDNSPIVCRGEEPNFILIRDYFGKDGMDDELMEVYQLLDAMVDIEGDVRYFLCGLESDESQTIDLNRESECWQVTETLMKELDAYYSEQIVLSPVSSDEYAMDEQEPDAFMEDYDEEDILDRERLTARSPQPMAIATHTISVVKQEDEEEETREEEEVAVESVPEKEEQEEQQQPQQEEEEEEDTTQKKVQFTAPSVNTNAQPDASFRKSQTGKSLSAKKAQSTRFKSARAKANAHLKRNRSLLLDPVTLDKVTQRHAKYSSMSPRYVLGVPGTAGMSGGAPSLSVSGAKPKFSFLNDLDVNDAIHSFGAVDPDTDDDEEEENAEVQLHIKTIDTKQQEQKQTKKTQAVPQFELQSQLGDPITIATSQTMPLPVSAISTSIDRDDFIPPPSALKLKTVKTLDKIKAEKLQKKQKRLSEKRNSSMKLAVNSMLKHEMYLKQKKNAHRRGLSSDAIAEIDFVTEMTTSNKRRPGKSKHKMSIQDTEQFGKVWRNTMAPRPTAKSIVSASSKHDEFMVLFQEHLSQIKENRSRQRNHSTKLEKRRSVPEFAMLSQIDSESDIIAHRERLSTLRDDQIIHFAKSNTLQSVNENKDFDNNESHTPIVTIDEQPQSQPESQPITIDSDWDDNMSQRHGCCYYFCCCCICNMCRGHNNNDKYRGSLSPESP